MDNLPPIHFEDTIIKRKIYFFFCRNCNKKIKGTTKKSAEYNYKSHIEGCKKEGVLK